jgi:hypothetical protein
LSIFRIGDKSYHFSRFPVYARSGWLIPQPDEPVPAYSSDIIRIRANDLMVQHPNKLTIRSVSSYSYNCVGMIFASRRAYIEITHINRILREDGFHQISINEITVGDIVLYKFRSQPSHVAIVTGVTGSIGHKIDVRVLSKWGLDAEFEHFMENVPRATLGEPAEFYTERVI